MPEKRVYAGLEVPEGLSKGEFKRQVKQQRREETREEFLEQRRIKRRAAHKIQRQNRRQRPTIVQEESGVSIVIDCGFDELMEHSERVSLAGQLTRCYSENRRAPKCVNLAISSFNKKLAARFNDDMYATQKLWRDVEIRESDIEPAPNTVYLTGDATTTLTELKSGHKYIIGGIVDKNRYKNLCLSKAAEMGIPCARLPIDEHIRVSGRRVLTTNQAFELLLRWLEFRDWKQAFEAVIPPRKLGEDYSEQDVGGRDADESSSGDVSHGCKLVNVTEAGHAIAEVPISAESAEKTLDADHNVGHKTGHDTEK